MVFETPGAFSNLYRDPAKVKVCGMHLAVRTFEVALERLGSIRSSFPEFRTLGL